jgi:hypothetical protein
MNIFLKIDDYGYVIDTVTDDYFNEQIIIDPFYYVTPYSIEERFIRPRFNRTLNKFVEGEIDEVILEQFKQLKKDQLETICDSKIEYGFISSVNGHHYRVNRDDQINMMGRKNKLDADPTILTIDWKTEDVGYIQHSREDWLKIYDEAFAHKETQLYKLNELKLNVDSCKSIDDINVVTWS